MNSAEPERLKLFGNLVPKFLTVKVWGEPSYSFDQVRQIMLSDMLERNGPVSTLRVGLQH